MDFLQNLLDSSEIPVITAFLLGLLTAVSPCPLATNITAIGFVSKDIYNKMKAFQLWFNRCVALLFILVGIYYAYMQFV